MQQTKIVFRCNC